jgi:hypothetical protein
MADDRRYLTVIHLREMADDFMDKYIEICRANGIELDEDFLLNCQQEFSEDYGYTSTKSYYRLLNTKEEMDAVETLIAKLKKLNVKIGHREGK